MLPRFLGWREWAPVAPARLDSKSPRRRRRQLDSLASAVGSDVVDVDLALANSQASSKEGSAPIREAIWSDEELDDPDGFDLSRWRKEHHKELGRGARMRQKACPGNGQTSSKSSRVSSRLGHLPAITAGDTIRDIENGGFDVAAWNRELLQANLQDGRPRRQWRQKQPQEPHGVGIRDHYGANPPMRPLLKAHPSADCKGGVDERELSEVIASLADPQTNAGICRGGLTVALNDREERLQEQARERRAYHKQEGQSNRSHAVQFAKSPTALEKSARAKKQKKLIHSGTREERRLDIFRSSDRERRLQKVLDRIRLKEKATRVAARRRSAGGTFSEEETPDEETPQAKEDSAEKAVEPVKPRMTGVELKAKIKELVMMGIKARRKASKRAVRLQRHRSTVLKSITSEEMAVYQEAFEVYQNQDRNLAADKALPCLWELGLRGRGGHERYAVEQAVAHLYILLSMDSPETVGERNKFDHHTQQLDEEDKSDADDVDDPQDDDISIRPAGQEQVMKSMVGQIAAQEEEKFKAQLEDEQWKDRVLEESAIRSPKEDSNLLFESDEEDEEDGASSSEVHSDEGAVDHVVSGQGGLSAQKSSRGCYQRRRGALAQIVEDAEPISFIGFITEIVPHVRRQILDSRCEEHMQAFMSLRESGNASGITRGSFEAYVKRRKLDWSLVEASLSAKDVENANHANPKKKKSQVTNMILITFAKGASEFSDGGRREDKNLEYDIFHELMAEAEEKCDRNRRAQEREIIAKTKISSRLFKKFRPELIRIYGVFQMYDSDSSNYLSHSEVRRLLKHFGLQPYSDRSATEIAEFLKVHDTDGNAEIDFEEFLSLMTQIRLLQRKHRRAKLKRAVRHRTSEDADNPMVHMDQVMGMLWHANIVRGRTEETIAKGLIDEIETDSQERVKFQAVEQLVQSIVEQVYSADDQRMTDLAASYGFTRQRLAEFQMVYDALDQDSSGSLSASEVCQALPMLMRHLPQEGDLRSLWEQVVGDLEQDMHFSEFLHLMKLAAAGEAIFAEEPPFRLINLDPAKARSVLRLFPISETYIEEVMDSELPDLLASFVGVDPSANLREDTTRPIRNVRMLMTLASEVAGRSPVRFVRSTPVE